jgi:hypothetical protein
MGAFSSSYSLAFLLATLFLNRTKCIKKVGKKNERGRNTQQATKCSAQVLKYSCHRWHQVHVIVMPFVITVISYIRGWEKLGWKTIRLYGFVPHDVREQRKHWATRLLTRNKVTNTLFESIDVLRNQLLKTDLDLKMG